MSRTTIDERVVEMRFDNKQFEAETKKTRASLEKLKEALKFPGAEESLKKVDNAVKGMSFDGLQAGIEALTKRFSTFGIVGMRIIENVTDGLMNKLARAVNFVSDSIVSGGIKRAMNIENAHFQLQALLKDELQVQAVMDNAMESVDGTAYAYDEAAKAASMFAASGIQAGDEMLQALKGITGVAAMTNSDFESMSMIFTTVAGNGRLMGDQLLQLSSRGLNAASTIADYFKEVRGQSSMTEGEIREMVSKGKISFQDFSDAMTWAFGDSAKRANETFTGAMSNMKSALARIGAGFVSPLIEQNGEMVNLFNALRIKINDVKSTLVFDEQTSALSGLTKQTRLMSDTVANLVKDGTLNFTDFTEAINGAGKSEERLAWTNELLSETFNKIKDEGKVGTDALHDFGRTGVQATKIVREYMNGVMNGTIKASQGMREAIEDITDGYQVMAGDVTKFAHDGTLSFDVFNAAIVHASGLAKEGTEITKSALKALFKDVKDAGSVSTEALMDFSRNGIDAAGAIKKYIDGVTNGTIRASYATRTAIEEMTGGVELASGDIQKFADEGKLSFAIFQSAMEESFGDSQALSKQFTDFFLDNMKKLVNFINQADMTKPMEAFYFSVESVKNVLKGLYSIIKPVGKAFGNVFLDFDMDDVIDIIAKIEEMTAQFKLSETGSENLRKAFKGVFDVGKALIDIILRITRAIIPSVPPVKELGGGFLGLAGSAGESLSAFAEWINTSEFVQKGIDGIAWAVQNGIEYIQKFIYWIKEFAVDVYNMPITQNAITALGDAFDGFGGKIEGFFKAAKENLKLIPEFFKQLFGFSKGKDAEEMAKSFENIEEAAGKLTFDKPIAAFEKFTGAIKDLGELLMTNKGIAAFVENAKTFFGEMNDAFKVDTLSGKLDAITSAFDKFIGWIKKNLEPMFKDVSFGGVVSAGTGIGMVYSIFKLAKSFDSIGSKIKAIPELLGPIKSTLSAYQKDLKANQLLKIAASIGILAFSLTILSFADFNQLMNAAITLGGVAAAIMWAASKFLGALNVADEIPDVLTALSKSLEVAAKKFGTALIIKAIGWTIKDVGKAIATIVGAISVLSVLASTNPTGLDKALTIVEYVGMVLGGVFGSIVFLATTMPKSAGTELIKIGGTVVMLSIALGIMVASLNKLMKMTLPSDYGTKLEIMVGLVGGLLTLYTAVAAISNYSGGSSISTGGSLLAMAGMMFLVVIALNQLFKMEIPSDWLSRLGILALVIGGLAGVFIAVNKLTGGKGGIKGNAGSFGQLIGMVGVLIAITWSIKELSQISGNQLMRGVISLGAILLVLSKTFSGLGKLHGGKDSAKAVFNMAIMIGVITAALGVLSMVPLGALVKAAVTLGSILLVLALDFLMAGQITDDAAAKAVLSMCLLVGIIAVALSELAKQPWEGLLAGSAGLSMVLLAFAGALKIISDINFTYTVDMLAMFVSMIAVTTSIAIALMFLSEQPWEGLLAGGAALSMVLLAFAEAMKIMSETTFQYDLATFAMFASMVVELGAITAALYILADKPWDGLLAAGTALSEVLLAVSVAALIVSKIKTDVKSGLEAIVFLDLFIADITAVLVAFWAIKEAVPDLDNMIASGTGTLSLIANAIGEFVGNLIGGFGAGVASGLSRIGQGLSDFMNNAGDFFDNLDKVDSKASEGVKNLAEAVLIITAADVLEGMTAFFTKGQSMAKFGEELKALGPALAEFGESVKDVDEEKVAGAAAATKIMAEVAKNLPKISGLGVLIFGATKSLADFGEELKSFGPHIAQFAEDVKDVKPEAVQGAADAASIMSEMAKTLPRSDGFAQKVFGTTKKLSDFGKELKSFAPDLLEFAMKVLPIKPEHVQGAANAATVLSTMAKDMPNTNSLWENLFGGGTVTLTQFGEDLVSFGGKMLEFAVSVAEFNGEKISEVVASFKELLDLIDYMGEKTANPIVDFSNDLTYMAEEGIESFVVEFENCSDKVTSAINTMIGYVVTAVAESGPTIKIAAAVLGLLMATTVSDSISEQKSKAEEAVRKYVEAMLTTYQNTFNMMRVRDMTTSGLQGVLNGINSKKPSIVAAMKTLATTMSSTYKTNLPAGTFSSITQNALQGIINGTNIKKPQVMSVLRTMCSQIISTIKTNLPAETITNIGSDTINYLAMGMALMAVKVNDTARNVANGFINAMNETLSPSTFSSMGSSIMGSFVDGVKSQQGAAVSAAQEVANSVNQALQSAINTDVASSIGENISSGVAAGIEKGKQKVETASKNMAKTPPKVAKGILCIASPSRLMEDLAVFVPEGFAKGILGGIRYVVAAAEDMSNAAVHAAEPMYDISKSILEYVDLDDLDVSPTITPVINMTDVTRDIGSINEMLNGVHDVQLKFNEAIRTPTVEARNISSSFLSRSDQNGLRDEAIAEGFNKLGTFISDRNPEEGAPKIENTFYIEGGDPMEIAEKVSQIIQHQVERKERVWG